MEYRFEQRAGAALPRAGHASASPEPQFGWRRNLTYLQSRAAAHTPQTADTRSLTRRQAAPHPSVAVSRPRHHAVAPHASGRPAAGDRTAPDPRFGWRPQRDAIVRRAPERTVDPLDAWLSMPAYWVPPAPANVGRPARDAGRRSASIPQSALVAAAVAAVAAGGLLGTGAPAPAKAQSADSTSEFPVVSAAAQSQPQGMGGGEGADYVVQPGDTLRDIAARFGVDLKAMIAVNGLPNPDLIFPGQHVVVPTGGAGPAEAPEADASGDMVIEVKPGDTLWRLALQYGVDARAIVDANGLENPDLILVGQKLKIPGGGKAATESQSGGGADPAAANTNEPVAEPAAAAPPVVEQAAPSGFAWPTQGRITQRFGPTNFWMEPAYQGYAHFHQGLDLGAPMNTPIVAADAGTVTFAGWSNSGYGFAVQIDHGNGLVTLYGHMAEQPPVSVGQQVSRGEVIGRVGSTGASTGAHLHFAVLENGVWADPLNYLP